MLDESSVISYLTERKLLPSDSFLGNATVEVLTGGVSCVVLAVTSDEREIVVKQALPELKTKAKWVADQRRAIVEAEAMRVYQSITPDSVPELIDCDEANFTLTPKTNDKGVTKCFKEYFSVGPSFGRPK